MSRSNYADGQGEFYHQFGDQMASRRYLSYDRSNHSAFRNAPKPVFYLSKECGGESERERSVQSSRVERESCTETIKIPLPLDDWHLVKKETETSWNAVTKITSEYGVQFVTSSSRDASGRKVPFIAFYEGTEKGRRNAMQTFKTWLENQKKQRNDEDASGKNYERKPDVEFQRSSPFEPSKPDRQEFVRRTAFQGEFHYSYNQSQTRPSGYHHRPQPTYQTETRREGEYYRRGHCPEKSETWRHLRYHPPPPISKKNKKYIKKKAKQTRQRPSFKC